MTMDESDIFIDLALEIGQEESTLDVEPAEGE
jgi:hypothetical protein